MTLSIHQEFNVGYTYPVIFTHGVFNSENDTFSKIIEQSGKQQKRILVVVDSGVFATHPNLITQIRTYFKLHQTSFSLSGDVHVVPGGEQAKQDPQIVNQIYQLIADQAICRHSFITVIGGGAVIDAVGYAAATAHRGVRLIRIPTTVLAQNDAGLGVKNAINLNHRKNFLGTFCIPWGVICDYDFLSTLDNRDKRAGMAEAVKVGLIRDRTFFNFLFQHRHELSRFEKNALQQLIQHCAKLHLDHIAANGDPFETGSARPLDFGHWLAHHLEELSRSEIRHGEAVAIGIAVDSHYSYQMGSLTENELQQILELIDTLGFELHTNCLSHVNTELALDHFRQHLGGQLSITLLKGIGQSYEVHQINNDLMQKSIQFIAEYVNTNQHL